MFAVRAASEVLMGSKGKGRGPLNAAGGEGSFPVSDMTRLRRFLILGVEGGTYYASERKLAVENAAAVARLLEAGRGAEVVAEILSVSLGGRAAKQSPTLFALAMAVRLGDPSTRVAAHAAIPQVCRTPTMLFEFLEVSMRMTETKGWGRGLRRAVASVYSDKPPSALAYAVTKYRQRNGWTHRDVLRLAHVKPESAARQLVLQYIVKGQVAAAGADEAEAVVGDFDPEMDKVMRFLQAVEDAKKCEDEAAMAALIVEHRLAREHVPSGLLQSTQVWAAMLPSMPLTAMIRNLGKMTSIGLLKPLSDHTATVVAKLEDKNALKRARVHPFSVLEALHTYRSGGGRKGSLKWDPTPEVAAALERAFYLSFGAVTPTGKRFVLGLDVSGSMGFQPIANSSITPMQGAAAMAMVTMRTEKRCSPMAFSHRLVPTGITAADSLETVLRKMESIPMGGTDCALPMIWALENGVDADVFIVYTDNETWAGATTPADALRQYRASSGIDAKLIVVGMTSGGFSIADPDDAGMMDVVGFDSNAPSVMQDFVTGGM